MRRRICWPKFDSVCLECGCLYCNDYELRDVDQIKDAARARGLTDAFTYGEQRGWANVEVRERTSR